MFKLDDYLKQLNENENLEELQGNIGAAGKEVALYGGIMTTAVAALYAANKLWDHHEINQKIQKACGHVRGNKEAYKKCSNKMKRLIRAARKRAKQRGRS